MGGPPLAFLDGSIASFIWRMIYIIQCGMSGITRRSRERLQYGRNEQGLQMHPPAEHHDVTTLTDLRRIHLPDPFRLTENSAQRAITGHLLGKRAVSMAEVGEWLSAA
jgi:hypothetical protein